MWNNNLQLQNDTGLREGTAYTSLTVLIEASQTQNCRRMRRESRPHLPACLMYLACPVWPLQQCSRGSTKHDTSDWKTVQSLYTVHVYGLLHPTASLTVSHTQLTTTTWLTGAARLWTLHWPAAVVAWRHQFSYDADRKIFEKSYRLKLLVTIVYFRRHANTHDRLQNKQKKLNYRGEAARCFSVCL